MPNARSVLFSLISEAGSSVPHPFHHDLFMGVLDPTSSHLFGNRLSYCQVHGQPNVQVAPLSKKAFLVS